MAVGHCRPLIPFPQYFHFSMGDLSLKVVLPESFHTVGERLNNGKDGNAADYSYHLGDPPAC